MGVALARNVTDTELQTYRQDGYLICHGPLFSKEKLDGLEAIAREYMDQVQSGKRGEDLNVPHFSDPRLFDFLMDPGVLDLIERFLGPNIALWTSQFFCKLPRTGQAVGWHADGHYWTDYLQPVNVVSIWLALDDVSAGNGCLRVLPGGHRRAKFRYEPRSQDENPFFPYQVCPDEIDLSKVQDVELERGEFILFDGNLLHGSNANLSEQRRYGYTLRYMSAACKFYPIGRSTNGWSLRQVARRIRRRLTGTTPYRHQVYLARGLDMAGNDYSPWCAPAASSSCASTQ